MWVTKCNQSCLCRSTQLPSLPLFGIHHKRPIKRVVDMPLTLLFTSRMYFQAAIQLQNSSWHNSCVHYQAACAAGGGGSHYLGNHETQDSVSTKTTKFLQQNVKTYKIAHKGYSSKNKVIYSNEQGLIKRPLIV